jgi:hypothetical protein
MAGSHQFATVLDLETTGAIDLLQTTLLSIKSKNSAASAVPFADATHVNIDHMTFADGPQGAITASDLQLNALKCRRRSAALLVADLASTHSEHAPANLCSGSTLGQLPSNGTQVSFFGGFVVNNFTFARPSVFVLSHSGGHTNRNLRSVPQHVRGVL